MPPVDGCVEAHVFGERRRERGPSQPGDRTSDRLEGSPAAVSDAFRVALLIPMCGSAGIWGPSCIASAEVAVHEINRGNGIVGREVQLLVLDSAIEAPAPVEH